MSGDEDESGGRRVGCLHCGEQILDIARTCPHCKLSALVEVVVLTALDERRRYELARGLLSSPAGARRTLSSIQKDLLDSPPVLAREVTRRVAEPAMRVAQSMGVQTSAEAARPAMAAAATEPAPLPGASRSWAPRAILGVAVGAGIWLAQQSWGDRPRDATKGAGPSAWAAASNPRRATRSEPAAPLPAPDPDPGKTTESEHAARARAALPSVVSIRCGKQGGAGFFIGPDLVLTNHHVLCGPRTPVQVATIDGRRSLGLVEGSDPYLDLGLVRVHMSGEPIRALAPADAAALEPNRTVFMIGSPAGLDFTLHEGRVSRVGQPILGLGYIQFDASINPGNSGGPLLDEAGRVVGVVSMKMDGEGLGLALPINYAFSYKGRGLLPSPEGWTTTEAFSRLSQAAEIEDAVSWSNVRGSMDVPVILSVRADPYRRPLIIVGRAAETEPPAEDFRFEFRSRNETLCWRSAHTARWQERLEKLNLPPRLSAWLEEHRLRLRLYTTEISPGLSGCPPFRTGLVTIHLEGGEGSKPFLGY